MQRDFQHFAVGLATPLVFQTLLIDTSQYFVDAHFGLEVAIPPAKSLESLAVLDAHLTFPKNLRISFLTFQKYPKI